MITSKGGILASHTVILALLASACGGGAPARAPEGGGAESAAPAAATAAEAAPAPTDAAGDAPAGGGEPSGAPKEEAGASGGNEFKTVDTHTAKDTHGVEESKLKATKTEALLKLVVVDKEKGPMKGIVVALTGADGKKYYAKETDATGYSELLVPNGQKYDLVYLSLGQADVAAQAAIGSEPNLTQKLTLRFKGWGGALPGAAGGAPPRFVLDGVTFDTGKATIRPESFPRLDSVVEFLQHKASARIEISGHTDNVGNPKTNKTLSEKRAQACRDYVVSKGIDASRIKAIGYGDERPVAPNDKEEGRAQNRRIEATEL